MWPFSKREWPKVEINEIKKRSRIVVVDDQQFPYQVLFRRDGYQIDKWDDVIDLPKLESGYYDIILLDLMGIGRDQSVEEGLGILKHIKIKNPTQIIIAYSHADFPVKYQEFFQMADHVMPKSADYVDFKRKVDEYLEKRFSIGFYLNKIQDIVKSEPDNVPDLTIKAKRAILKNSTTSLKKYLDSRLDNPATIKNVLTIVNIAIEVMKLWKSP